MNKIKQTRKKPRKTKPNQLTQHSRGQSIHVIPHQYTFSIGCHCSHQHSKGSVVKNSLCCFGHFRILSSLPFIKNGIFHFQKRFGRHFLRRGQDVFFNHVGHNVIDFQIIHGQMRYFGTSCTLLMIFLGLLTSIANHWSKHSALTPNPNRQSNNGICPIRL